MPRRYLSPAATIAGLILVSLVMPILFLFPMFASSGDRIRAEEPAPKQAFLPPTRASDSPTNSKTPARRVTSARPRVEQSTNASAPTKPSGKMEFFADSPTPRAAASSGAARSAANVTARRQSADHPAKVAIARFKPPFSSRSKTPQVTPQAAPQLAEQPTRFSQEFELPARQPVVAREPVATRRPVVSRELPLEPELIAESEPEMEEPELVSEPEWESDVVVAAPSELPINFGERSKRLTPEFERPIVRRSQPVSPTLDDEIDEDDEVPQPTRSVRDVVQLGFEDNDLAEDDADENMELVEVEEPTKSVNRLPKFVEPIPVDEVPQPTRSVRDVVQLELEDSDLAEDADDENMELVEVEEPTKSVNRLPRFVEPIPVLEIQTVDSEDPMQTVEPDDQPMRLEIQTIAAQEVPEKSQVTNAPHEIEPEVAPPSDEVLAELKPVRSIEIRKAIQIPALADMDNPQLREPPDQAQAYLRKLKRQPYKFWPVYRDPWVANRDSYAFHHNPLWFEDPNLERCGRGCGHVTSVSSFVQFSANIAILPYRMTAQPSCSCVRTLPDCTVCQKFGYDAYLPPWSWRAAAVQAGAVVGGIYVIP